MSSKPKKRGLSGMRQSKKPDRQKNKQQQVLAKVKKAGKTIWVGSPSKPFADAYLRGPQIGEAGQFGVTYKCWAVPQDKDKGGPAPKEHPGYEMPKDDKKFVAVKHINKMRYYRIAEKHRKRILHAMQNEIEILQTINHKHVVKLMEVYEDKPTLYLVMEYCNGGELFARIVKRKHYNEKDAARVAKQLFHALDHLQDNNIAHCDLKPDNIMFGDKREEADVKIIDFGMAQVVHALQYMTHLCGTPYYTAPEIIGAKKYQQHVDMWSMGVILFVMIFGYPPFYVDPAKYGKHERDAIYQKIKQGFIPQVRNTATKGYGPWFPDHIPSSPEVRDLISNCLQLDEKNRYKPKAALMHPWIVTGGDSKNSIPATLNPVVIQRMANFSNSNKLKLVVLRIFRNQFIRMRPDHFAQLEAMFQQMDKDGDGIVTFEEFEDAVDKVPEIELSREQIQNMFSELMPEPEEPVELPPADPNNPNPEIKEDEVNAVMKSASIDSDVSMRPRGIVFGDLLNALVNGYLIDSDERLYSAFLDLDEEQEGTIKVEQLKKQMKKLDPLGEYDKALVAIEEWCVEDIKAKARTKARAQFDAKQNDAEKPLKKKYDEQMRATHGKGNYPPYVLPEEEVIKVRGQRLPNGDYELEAKLANEIYEKEMAKMKEQGLDARQINYEQFLMALHPAFDDSPTWMPPAFSNMKSVQAAQGGAKPNGADEQKE